MKFISKVLGSLGALLLMAGALLALTGWFMGGRSVRSADDLPWPFYRSFASSSTWETADTPDDWVYDGSDHLPSFTDLDVELDLGSVTVQPGEDFGIRLSWTPGNSDYALHYEVKNGTLRVWNSSIDLIRLPTSVPTLHSDVVITVPEGTRLSQADLDLSLGDAYLSGFQVQDLTVDCDLGEASIAYLEAGEAELTLDLGSLTLLDCRFMDAGVSLSMGDLNASELTVTGELTVDSDMGSVELYGALGRKTDISADAGDVVVTAGLPRTDCGYDLHADMGNITVDGEDYRHTAVRSGGTHQIKIENDLGDIELSFTG